MRSNPWTKGSSTYLKLLTGIFAVTLVIGVVLVSFGGVQIGRSMAIYGEVEKEIKDIEKYNKELDERFKNNTYY